MIRRNILILEPERDVAELFARAIEVRKDYKCYLASSEGEGMDLLKEIPFGLILLDASLAMASDFSLLKRLRRLAPNAIIILDAYLHQKQYVRQSMALGATGHIIKPIKVELLRRQIDEFYLNTAEAAP